MPAKTVRTRNVLVLHRGGDQIRGSEDVLLNLLEHLDSSRLKPVVVYSHPVLAAPLQRLGVAGVLSPFPELAITRDKGLNVRLPLVSYLRALWRIFREARRRASIDVILCNGGGPCQLGLPLGFMLRAPVICYQHHPAPKDLLYSWLVPLVPTIVFNSQHTAADTRSTIGKTGEIVQIGVDIHRFFPASRRDPALRQSLGVSESSVVFAQVGALVPHKGLDVLLNAFALTRESVRDVALLIIGDGPERTALEHKVTELGLESVVHFVGRVPDVLPYLQHAVDVHVLASSDEGLGLVNLEAAACGLPTVGTDGTGIRESIRDGETGLLFSPGSPDALAQAMLRLARDPDLRSRMGEAGRKFVSEEFSLERFCHRMQDILLEHARN